MSAELGDFGGTFAGTVTAGGGAGLGLEATEELSQPMAASANAASEKQLCTSAHDQSFRCLALGHWAFRHPAI